MYQLYQLYLMCLMLQILLANPDFEHTLRLPRIGKYAQMMLGQMGSPTVSVEVVAMCQWMIEAKV